MPPSIHILPPDGRTTARKGGSVTFECKANGNPPPSVQWSKKASKKKFLGPKRLNNRIKAILKQLLLNYSKMLFVFHNLSFVKAKTILFFELQDGLLPSGLQVQSGYALSLLDVQRQHAGTYQCTASNGIGQPVTAEVKLHILCKTKVTIFN